MAEFSLTQMIEEVDRELKLRDELYPRMVTRRQMRESVAKYHRARMQAVRDYLAKELDAEAMQ